LSGEERTKYNNDLKECNEEEKKVEAAIDESIVEALEGASDVVIFKVI
jgi:hypothetical protein